MSLVHVLERPEHLASEIHPAWGNRFSALQILKLFAPRLLQREVTFLDLGELLCRAFPDANVATSERLLWNSDRSRHAFVLYKSSDRHTGNVGAISLLDIANPANLMIVAFHLAYSGGDGISLLAPGELSITMEGKEARLYPAATVTTEPFRLVTFDGGYEDPAVDTLARVINKTVGSHYRHVSPLYRVMDWLRTPEEVLLLKPGKVEAAWFAPLLAAAAAIGATALTLESDGRLTPWSSRLSYPSQNLKRPLLLVHAGLETRFLYDAALDATRN